jgi:hypothetical protein
VQEVLFMGYQSRMKSPRISGRGYGKPRREKAKAKKRKHRSFDGSIFENNRAATMGEIVDRTLKWLSNLGSQKFASTPYSEHFSRWLMNLNYVLSKFESPPSISADEQFMKESSQVLSDVELKLEERRRQEVSLDITIKGLSDSKILLKRIEEEYATMARDVEARKNSEIKRLNNDIDGFRSELNDIARMKTGLFKGIFKKARAQKKTETTQKLDTAERELELLMLDFGEERERIRDEFERKKHSVIKQIRNYQKDIETVDTDGSLEDRRAACEALIHAVNALFQRKTLQLH